MKEVIDYLQGTCHSLDYGLCMCGKEFDDITAAEWSLLEDEIFQCEECSWWCPLGEAADGYETVCDECYSSEEDE